MPVIGTLASGNWIDLGGHAQRQKTVPRLSSTGEGPHQLPTLGA